MPLSKLSIEQILMNKWSEKWFDFVKQNPDKPWNWHGISRNPNVTWEIIQANPDKPWHWSEISRNPMTSARNNYIRTELFPICQNLLGNLVNSNIIKYIIIPLLI